MVKISILGIDVHLKSWSVTIITESGYKKTHSQKPSAKELFEHLKKHYPNGKYQAVYESGFSGYSTCYALKEYGIEGMIIHAADVPTSQYDHELFRKNLLKATRMVRDLSKKSLYSQRYENLISIPGIGIVTAMSILTEIGDASRFHNQREFASFLGLIPSCHSSGESIVNTEKTFRGNKHLGSLVIEYDKIR